MGYDCRTWVAGTCPVDGHSQTLTNLDGTCLLCRVVALHDTVSRLLPHIKPTCRNCSRPAVQYYPTPTGVAEYICAAHPNARAKDLPGADVIRMAMAFHDLRRQPKSEGP